ncbi:Laccase-15 [Vitis vinifera]|uniref:Laccase-15 n=1 Tax=Vitis vinifera TaxID=29760 RepID=A0A438IWM4_VITVI|nr:Laccase-15 [Vitis vinifera]
MPIQPGSKFSQKIILSSEEALYGGMLTVIGPEPPFMSYNRLSQEWNKYPFHNLSRISHHIRQWWKSDVNAVRNEVLAVGADGNASNSLLIMDNLVSIPCSKSNTFSYGGSWKDLSIRIINAALHEPLFFSIAKHKMIVVGTDEANQRSITINAAITYSEAPTGLNVYDNTTTQLLYNTREIHSIFTSLLTSFTAYNDTMQRFRSWPTPSLVDAEHPCNVH